MPLHYWRIFSHSVLFFSACPSEGFLQQKHIWLEQRLAALTAILPSFQGQDNLL
jgi:hypothetical protein